MLIWLLLHCVSARYDSVSESSLLFVNLFVGLAQDMFV